MDKLQNCIAFCTFLDVWATIAVAGKQYQGAWTEKQRGVVELNSDEQLNMYWRNN